MRPGGTATTGARPLTTRQQEVLDVIVTYVDQNHEAPSVRLLARRFGLNKSTIQDHLEALHRKGWLVTPRPFILRNR